MNCEKSQQIVKNLMEKYGKRIYNYTIYNYKGVSVPYEMQKLFLYVFHHVWVTVWQFGCICG